MNKITKLIDSRLFKSFFVFFSVLTLIITSVFWAVVGASAQHLNSDQLIDSYMLQDNASFAGAGFPGAHTFLFKWPLFALMRVTGYSPDAFMWMTVGTVLLTVIAFAFILYKIEKRPLIFGAICLALSLVFLLIPAQPYPGALLPVNMAMLTTRNLEYILYLLALILISRSKNLKSPGLWGSILILAVLIASDKLFAALSLGGSVLAALVFTIIKKKQNKESDVFLRWLFASILSFALALVILAVINSFGWTNVVNDESISPFTFIKDINQFANAVIYAFAGILTNFGANPAYATVIAADLPKNLISGFLSPAGLAYAACLMIFVTSAFAVTKLLVNMLKSNDDKGRSDVTMVVMLLFSAVTGFGSFIISDHYYPVDARYLAIFTFTFFVGLVVFLKAKNVKMRFWVPSVVILLVAIPVAVGQCWHIGLEEQKVNNERDVNNQKIVDALKNRNSTLVIGDYWSVIPLKTYPGLEKITALSQTNCYTPSVTLTSKAWLSDLANKPFAYLATLDQGSKDKYNGCTEDQILSTFGQPNDSLLISGALDKPQQVLLFYDKGTSAAKQLAQEYDASVTPAGLANFRANKCDTKSTLTVVAHEDDDILFMNPTTINSINAGDCVRTVYVTAGDAGGTKEYWQGREDGAKAGYAKMAGKENVWTQRTINVDGYDITVNTLKDSKNISLIFLRLPDGNGTGSGFDNQGNQSLRRLLNGDISSIKSVDDQTTYTKDQLINLMSGIMQSFVPVDVRTQNNSSQVTKDDHSDHVAVGDIVTAAFNEYKSDHTNSTIAYFSGYYVSTMPSNLSKDIVTKKEDIFMLYGQSDPSVCHSHTACFAKNEAYGIYLSREYKIGQ